MNTVLVISPFGSFMLDEPFVVYSSEERLYNDEKGVGLHYSDLVFETGNMKYIFENLYLGFDYYLEIIEELKDFAAYGNDVLILDLRKLLDFIEPELLEPGKSVVIESKSGG